MVSAKTSTEAADSDSVGLADAAIFSRSANSSKERRHARIQAVCAKTRLLPDWSIRAHKPRTQAATGRTHKHAILHTKNCNQTRKACSDRTSKLPCKQTSPRTMDAVHPTRHSAVQETRRRTPSFFKGESCRFCRTLDHACETCEQKIRGSSHIFRILAIGSKSSAGDPGSDRPRRLQERG